MAKGKKGKSSSGGFFRIPSGVKRTIFALFFILLGGLLFNLDRLDRVGGTLLQVKRFLPRSIARFLPGGTAQTGTAQAEQRLAGRIGECAGRFRRCV